MDIDELDRLIELEAELIEEEASNKRSLADLHSQQEAARSLADAPDGSKRARTDGPPGAAPSPRSAAAREADDDALLALAAEDEDYSQRQPTTRTYQEFANTEEQMLLALAADSQPSAYPGGPAASRRTFTTATAGLAANTEERQLLALAASTQPSQSVAAGRPGGGMSSVAARPGQGRPNASATAGAAGGTEQDDFDLDAMLDELLEEGTQPDAELDRQPGAPARPSTAAAAAAAGKARQQQPGPGSAAQAAAELLFPPRQYVPPAKEVYRIRGASLEVTSETGERVYCQVEAPTGAAGAAGGRSGRRVNVAALLRRARGALLSQPISALLEAIEKDQYERAVAETAAAAAAAERGASPAGQGVGQRAPGSGGAGKAGSSLWVEKYAPKGYIDLLSDEQINREVVRWLKGWDPVVFGTAAPAQLAQQARGGSSRPPFSRRGQQGRQDGGVGEGVDALGRPEHKVILIAGPPGLGKTTLAHVCARHCGYRPLEINASDDRSGGSLQARILDAVEMQSVMDRQRRPNCVIIDEIDGASGGAEGRSGIAALLKIVNAPAGKPPGKQQPSSGGVQGTDGEGDSDGEGEEAGGAAASARRALPAGGGRGVRPPRLRPLMRPIICICNDLYAPALRPLRDVARVFHFKKPQAERLAQRLRAVCAAEGLRCDKSALRLLVERTDCDIRSCLNTLQFLSKRQNVVRAADLAGLSVGQKDLTKGAFAVWTELLHKRKAPGIIGRAAEGEAARCSRLYDSLQDFGEGELVLGGVHENMLALRYFDMALQRTTAVLSHLCDADAFLRACHRSADFSLLKYLPAPLVLVGGIVAGPDRPQLQWPRAAFEAQRRSGANAALLQGWMLGMPAATCAATSRRSMVLEVLPSLMHIAAPALRPVSQHLYSLIEQETVRHLVDTLLAYNLRYCLDASPEEEQEAAGVVQGGAAEASEQQQQQQQQRIRGAPLEPPLRFRPAVHRTCTFPGMAPKGKQLPAAVRQTISHEADMEAIRRAEVARRGGSGAAQAQAGGAGGAADESSEAAALQPANRSQRLGATAGVVPLTLAERMRAAGTAAGVEKKRQAPARKGTWLDQLKEQRQARATAAVAGGEGGAGGAGRHRFPVLYKFHEGYTNAVKRPVLMRDLL